MSWWVSAAYEQSPVFLYSWIFWVIFSIVCHELAHGWAAIRVGDETPRMLGHMTWNPLVHMGGASLLMFALFGFCWGLMPVNPSRFRGRYAESWVALAGPGMNLLQFIILVPACAAWLAFAEGVSEPLRTNMRIFLYAGAMINLMGVLFNLVPVPPLDGSKVMANISRGYRDLIESEKGQIATFIAAMLLFMVGGSKIWAVTMTITFGAISIVASLMGDGATSIFGSN